MAITLRNKRIEEKIRAIGRRTGEGPSAVIARLVESEEQASSSRSDRTEADQRFERACAFLDQFPPSTELEKHAMRAAEDEMYDWGGLPR